MLLPPNFTSFSSVSGPRGRDQTCISYYVPVTKINCFWELAKYLRKKTVKPTRFDKKSRGPSFVNERIKTIKGFPLFYTSVKTPVCNSQVCHLVTWNE